MIKVEITPADVATKLGIPETAAQEVIRRLFLTSTQIVWGNDSEVKFRVAIAEKPSEYSGQITNSPVAITVQHRGWQEGNKVKDKATLLTYIEESAPSLIDLKPWR